MQRNPFYRREIALRPSLRSRALNALLRLTVKRRIPLNADLVALRRNYEKLDARQFRVGRDVTRSREHAGSVPAEWVSVPASRSERVLLYFHGGSFAFRFPNAHAGLAARLSRRIGTRALIPDYRLAPEHPFPAAPEDCHATYRWLLAQGYDPANIVFAGDSAGGNLALDSIVRFVCQRTGWADLGLQAPRDQRAA